MHGLGSGKLFSWARSDILKIGSFPFAGYIWKKNLNILFYIQNQDISKGFFGYEITIQWRFGSDYTYVMQNKSAVAMIGKINGKY